MVNQYTKQELISKSSLEDLYYKKEMSYKEISNFLKVSVKVVFNRMKEYNLTPRKQARRGKDKYYRNGYVYLYIPNHPRADDRGRVFEHIIIMEKHLGRYLNFTYIGNAKDEIIHHKNKNKLDNRIENLILTTNGEHLRKYHSSK